MTTRSAEQMKCCLQVFFAVGNVAQATLILGFLCVNFTLDQRKNMVVFTEQVQDSSLSYPCLFSSSLPLQ